MTRTVLFSTCLALLTVMTDVRGQPGTEPPPHPAFSPEGASPPGAKPVPGTSQPDPSVLFPTIRPAETTPSAATTGGCPTCDASGETFWTRPTLTGDWGGLRPRLSESGVTFGGSLTQFWFGLGGGINRPPPPLPGLPLEQGNRFEYTGRGDYEMLVDLEKFGGLPKGRLLVRAQNWFGHYGNVSLATGAFPPAIFAAALPPAPNDPGVPFITDFILTQPLSKDLVVFAGKKNVLGVADQCDFAGGNGTVQFLNQTFIANPAFLLGLPYSSFTAGVASPQEWGTVAAYVFDPQDRTKDFFRLDDLFSRGVIVGGEVKVFTNLFSMPGEHHVGGMWKHVALTDLRFNEPSPAQYPYVATTGFPTLSDSFTIYYGFDQHLQVYSRDKDLTRGWGLFGRASISDANPTPYRYFLSLGIGGYSPFAWRRGDTFGLAYYFTGTSQEFGPLPRALLGPREAGGVELFYNCQLTPWMNLTPDFQVIKPGAAGNIADTAYTGGVRLNLKF